MFFRSLTAALAVAALAACPGSATPDDRGAREMRWQSIPDGVGGCGPKTCKGCCSPAGACAAESTERFCGLGGVACVDCSAMKAGCVNGNCQIPTPPNVFEDQFSGAAFDPNRWIVASAGGASVSLLGGEAVLQVPAQPNAWAELVSKATFPVGSTLEARVYLSAAQFYDHRGLGFSDHRVGAHCGDSAGESQAVQWRAQDEARVAQAMAGAQLECGAVSSSYAAGYRTVKIVRKADRVDFYENGLIMKTVTAAAQLPAGALPVRFSAFTYYSSPPTAPIGIRIDSVKVQLP